MLFVQILRSTVSERDAVTARSTRSRRVRHDAMCRKGRRVAALRTTLPDVGVTRLDRTRSTRTSTADGRRPRLRVDGRRRGRGWAEVPDRPGCLRLSDSRRRDGFETGRQWIRSDCRLGSHSATYLSSLQFHADDFQLSDNHPSAFSCIAMPKGTSDRVGEGDEKLGGGGKGCPLNWVVARRKPRLFVWKWRD